VSISDPPRWKLGAGIPVAISSCSKKLPQLLTHAVGNETNTNKSETLEQVGMEEKSEEGLTKGCQGLTATGANMLHEDVKDSPLLKSTAALRNHEHLLQDGNKVFVCLWSLLLDTSHELVANHQWVALKKTQIGEPQIQQKKKRKKRRWDA